MLSRPDQVNNTLEVQQFLTLSFRIYQSVTFSEKILPHGQIILHLLFCFLSFCFVLYSLLCELVLKGKIGTLSWFCIAVSELLSLLVSVNIFSFYPTFLKWHSLLKSLLLSCWFYYPFPFLEFSAVYDCMLFDFSSLSIYFIILLF